MNRSIRFASAVMALSMAIVFFSNASCFGQRRSLTIGDLYGIGPEGTDGRGMAHMRGTPSDPDGAWMRRGYGVRNRNSYSNQGASSWSSPGYTYSSGYSSAPRTNAPPAAPAPYLTNRYYEPGDGYRYPLYYNPSTGTYFYYPVRR